MLVVQTAAEPPNHGRMCLLTINCTWNNRNALRNEVKANISATVRNGMGLDSLLFGLVATEFEGTSFLGDPIAFSQRFSLA
jgi:hypothetical protein